MSLHILRYKREPNRTNVTKCGKTDRASIDCAVYSRAAINISTSICEDCLEAERKEAAYLSSLADCHVDECDFRTYDHGAQRAHFQMAHA